MSEEITQTENADQESQVQDSAQAESGENTQPETQDAPTKGTKTKEPKKSAKERAQERKAQRADDKEKSRMKKEWEDSIVASKRVKAEERRRKLKRAMLIMLVFALIVTSIVYVMLLFIQENNVRITASSRDQNKSIELSSDNVNWTPYLNAKGPETMWDISYNKVYAREPIKTIDEVTTFLTADEFVAGSYNGKDYICFAFLLKNSSDGPASLDYEMTLENDDYNLQNAVRVMWGQSLKGSGETSVEIFASLSDNPRLANTSINVNRTPEQKYLEYVAYPVGSDHPSYDLAEYEAGLDDYDSIQEAREAGYFETTPFFNNKYVFQKNAVLQKGDIMYCYVCIWLEGSDFDCNDDVVGGYVKLGINFVAY